MVRERMKVCSTCYYEILTFYQEPCSVCKNDEKWESKVKP